MRLSKNVLVHANCLTLLERMPDEKVMLAYLDPPWGTSIDLISTNQLDNEQKDTYRDFVARVLQQIHRVLSSNGTLYYHHSSDSLLYIHLLLDQIFGEDKFRAKIVLPRLHYPFSIRWMGTHSTIVIYSKSDSYVKNQQYKPLMPDLLAKYNHHDEAGDFALRALTRKSEYSPKYQFKWRGYELPPGQSWIYSYEKLERLEQQGKIYHDVMTRNLPYLKIYLADSPGIPIGNTWDDIQLQSMRKEILEGEERFCSQQSIALLDRIIKMGSNPEDVILDPFCGLGTTLVAAHNNDRRWVGCDISEEAYFFTIKRLEAQAGLKPQIDFQICDKEYLQDSFEIIEQPYRELILSPKLNVIFVLNQPVSFEENIHYEFKEIKGRHPINAITKVVDVYAVAYLNSRSGGSIFWGIRDSDGVVVGVKLDRGARDRLRRVVFDKLNGVTPTLSGEMYILDFHSVYSKDRIPVQDLYVIQLQVSAISQQQHLGPYSTKSGKYYEKTIAGKREISEDELVAWKERYRIKYDDE